MARFWISWYQPTEDYRPLTDPPNPAILGWWCSGSRGADDASTLCALVKAESEADAIKTVQVDWPEASEWRFIDAVEPDWRPGDRFVINAAWMKLRIESQS